MDPDGIVNELKEHFILKEVLDPAKKQQHYLGAMIGKYKFSDGSYGWYMLAKEDLSCTIPAMEATWDDKLYQKASSPLIRDYHPALDISPLLSNDDALLFASYIGILQWAVELGWIDLTQSVSLMSQFWNAPHEGHMAVVLHIFGYVKGHLNLKVVFDPAYQMWSNSDWHEDAEWKEFYPDTAEPIAPNAPEPQGKDAQINVYCDATHATCLAMCRLMMGIIMFLNGAAVKWYSKRQNTVESSTFGSEFVALKIWWR